MRLVRSLSLLLPRFSRCGSDDSPSSEFDDDQTTGFIPFLESTSVKSLILRTYTTDAGMIFPSFGPKTRLGLEELAWTTMGYQQVRFLLFLSSPSSSSLEGEC